MTRNELAFHFYKLMNHGQRRWDGGVFEYAKQWEALKARGYHVGYLNIADDVIAKGYK